MTLPWRVRVQLLNIQDNSEKIDKTLNGYQVPLPNASIVPTDSVSDLYTNVIEETGHSLPFVSCAPSIVH